jgi:hypothetical protein
MDNAQHFDYHKFCGSAPLRAIFHAKAQSRKAGKKLIGILSL